MLTREVIAGIIDALQAGEVPAVSAQDIACFSEESSKVNPHVGPEVLQRLVASWTREDIPVFERALQAVDAGELAWLGFKLVYDAQAALTTVEEGAQRKFGEAGSADAFDAVFFCNDQKEMVCARQPSARDIFQMKDATRGPRMHTDQFPGLTWVSVPLFDSPTVWLLGASDLASETAALAHRVGFDVVVIDDDSAYLTEERFPTVQRILLESWDDIDKVQARDGDYACVLTIGHVRDTEACLWAASQDMHYMGMLGSAGKNETVHAKCMAAGMSEEAWARIKRPIGLGIGAKTPAELALAIVGELVDVRYKQRYSEEERARHDSSIGRK